MTQAEGVMRAARRRVYQSPYKSESSKINNDDPPHENSSSWPFLRRLLITHKSGYRSSNEGRTNSLSSATRGQTISFSNITLVTLAAERAT